MAASHNKLAGKQREADGYMQLGSGEDNEVMMREESATII